MWGNRYRRMLVSGTVAIAVFAATVVVAIFAVIPPAAAASADPFTAFVLNQGSGSVSTFATTSHAVGTPIRLPEPNSGPRHIAITPDNKTAYVADTGAGTVTPIDVASNTLRTPIPVGNAWGIAIAPDGKTAYVTVGNAVIPIDLATNTLGEPITVGYGAQGIAITPDGHIAYVANNGSNTVTPIALTTNTAGAAIPVGSMPYGIAVTPDGKSAYVTNSGSNTVTPIDIATNTAGSAITVGINPEDIAVTPPAVPLHVYVANFGGSVSDIIPSFGEVRRFIVFGNPSGVAIAPDGTEAYVSDYTNGVVIPIDINSRLAGTPITVGTSPRGIAITKYQTGLAANSSPSVAQGGTISDTATLTNALAPAGSLTFQLFGPGATADCTGTPVFTSTKTTTTTNGTNGTSGATSDAFTANTPGTYRWVVRYSGDFSNAATATACGDPTQTVIVGRQLTSMAVAPANPSIPAGTTQAFTSTGTYSDGSTEDITSAATWSSSTTSVATINATGLATGVGQGTSTITASSGAVSGSTTLTVTAPALSSIAATPANPSIPAGTTQAFTATGTYTDASTNDITSTVTWSSSNTSIATINGVGLASAVAPGTSTITAEQASIRGSTTLTVTKADQYITFSSASPTNATFSGPTYTVAATATSGLPVSFSIGPAATSVCSISGLTVSFVGVGTCVIVANQAGNANFSAAPQVQQSFPVAKATPEITWANPGPITYGTALSSTQLNATASVPGSLSYTPPAETILNGGPNQLSVTFTPTDTAHYRTTTASVTVTVDPAAATVVYNGQQIVNVGSTLTPAALLSSPATGCQSGQTVTFSLDTNPTNGAAGPYTIESATTGASGQATGAAITTTGWLDGVYALTANLAPTTNCLAAPGTATLTVASPGDSASGGGWYSLSGNGRVNFGFTVHRVPDTTNQYSGQVVLINKDKWRLKGTLSTYGRTTTGQGVASGTGNLYWWNQALNGGLGDWQLAQSGVSFTTSFDQGTNLKLSTCDGTNGQGCLGVHINYTPVSPQPNAMPNSTPQPTKGGSIKVS